MTIGVNERWKPIVVGTSWPWPDLNWGNSGRLPICVASRTIQAARETVVESGSS